MHHGKTRVHLTWGKPYTDQISSGRRATPLHLLHLRYTYLLHSTSTCLHQSPPLKIRLCPPVSPTQHPAVCYAQYPPVSSAEDPPFSTSSLLNIHLSPHLLYSTSTCLHIFFTQHPPVSTSSSPNIHLSAHPLHSPLMESVQVMFSQSHRKPSMKRPWTSTPSSGVSI